MNFFHRPKTPAASPTLDGASRHSRPKLTARATDKAGKVVGRDKHSPPSCEDEAVKPFDYVAPEDHKLYLGTWKPLRMVDTIHGRLMSDVGNALPVNFNGELCQIFEDYRRVCQENTGLVAKDQAVSERIDELNKEHAHQKTQWQEDEADYVKEIKRLETMIAHSNHGIEGVIRARRDSIIRKKREAAKTCSGGRAIGESTQGYPHNLCEVSTELERDYVASATAASKPGNRLHELADAAGNAHAAAAKCSERAIQDVAPTSRRGRPYSFLQDDELNFERTKTVRHRPRSSSLSQILPLEEATSHQPPEIGARMRPRPSSLNSLLQEQVQNIAGKLLPGQDYSKAPVDREATDFKTEPQQPASDKVYDELSCKENNRLSETKYSGISAGHATTGPSSIEGLKHDHVAKSDFAVSQVGRQPSPATATAAAKAAVTSAGKHKSRNLRLNTTGKSSGGAKTT